MVNQGEQEARVMGVNCDNVCIIPVVNSAPSGEISRPKSLGMHNMAAPLWPNTKEESTAGRQGGAK